MAEEAIFYFILETLGKLVTQEAEILFGVKDQVEILEQRLKQMHWFLRDVDANQERGKRVVEWVLQARDLAYKAEDLIETYAFKIASRRQGGVAGKIKRFLCLLDECFVRHQLGSGIESLLKRISDLTKNLDEYGITSIMENRDGYSNNNGGGGSSFGRHLARRTYSILAAGEDIFIGVENDAAELADVLVGDEYGVLGMCGMGGIGKTTLARKVYHHRKVRTQFEGFVWVCISQQWNKNDILQGILIKLMPEKRELIEKWRDEELVRELSQALQDRRCLVVLDDIWEVEAWESIKHGFPVGVRGSKILITTRNVDVFTQIDANGYLHEPRLLSTDESWELLCRKGVLRRYGDQDFQEHERFEELGKNMVTHCGGLPLAVVVLGGILAAKHSYREWEKVHRNIKSFLGNGKNAGIDQGKISQVLALSYDDLPFKLKPCFLYLSKYSEDEDIKVEQLYQIWMAEGMVSTEDRLANETMMEVAERYLGELAERCMVFVEKEKVPMFLQFRSCNLHDLMREVCLLKAREENFLHLGIEGYHLTNEETSLLSQTTVRLAIDLTDEKDAQTFTSRTNALIRQLRSFSLVLRNSSCGTTLKELQIKFSDFVLLRVVCLEGFQRCRPSKNSVDSICTLVHLRYLSLRNSRLKFPSSIGKLRHLQTLDLRDNDVITITNGIENLEQLKHLYLPGEYTCNVGVELQRLRRLEILENFKSDQWDAEHLSTLTNLQSLSATVSTTEYLKVFVNQVTNLTSLRFLSLTLWGCDFSGDEEFAMVRGVFSLHCLTSLDIVDCRMSRLPAYEAGFCKNLHILSLYTSIPVEDLHTLEKFPNLIKLRLWKCFDGREMMTHVDGFPKLRALSLFELSNLEKWMIEDGAMPHLSILSISNCRNLKTIHGGFKFLTSLKELNLYSMSDDFVSWVQKLRILKAAILA